MRNVSTEDYGIDSLLGQRTATRSIVRNIILSPPDDNSTELHEEDFIRAGQSICMTKMARIPDHVRTHSVGTITVDLSLPRSDDSNQALLTPRAIATHESRIQVCDRFEHRKSSRFLLVMNASVSSSGVNQIVDYIENAMCFDVNIFNITQHGSFILPSTGQSVLSLYEGKSIIICGNAFPFFYDGMREAWQLLDPWEVARLAKLNTTFLFMGASDASLSQEWYQKMRVPAPSAAANSSLDAENLDGSIAGLSPEQSNVHGQVPGPLIHQYESRPHWLSLAKNTELALLMRAQKDTVRLGNAYPLRRFILTPQVQDDQGHRYGRIEVRKGVPATANIQVSTLPLPREGQLMSGHHKEAQKRLWDVQQRAGGIALQLKKNGTVEEGVRGVLLERTEGTVGGVWRRGCAGDG
jgi:hypothetical protein